MGDRAGVLPYGTAAASLKFYCTHGRECQGPSWGFTAKKDTEAQGFPYVTFVCLNLRPMLPALMDEANRVRQI